MPKFLSNDQEFEELLDIVCKKLTGKIQNQIYTTSIDFENAVRTAIQEEDITIDFAPHPQAFPDIAIEKYGVEVKFTTNDTWRSVANSVLETNRIHDVKKVYLVFGKMGGIPEVRWELYEKSVMHVRTSHVPRFEVEISNDKSLFELMGIAYDKFRLLPMHEKMEHIRSYARSRLRPGERLWWLEDDEESSHTLPLQARLYTKLGAQEKLRLRAEAALLCPQIVRSGRSRSKYDDAVLYLLTYHGVLCHQARDLFSAGSVANPNNEILSGPYIEHALKLLEDEIRLAANRLEDGLFLEYWGKNIPKNERIAEWLKMADAYATDWTPSQSLFLI